jgi:hypothetical protein
MLFQDLSSFLMWSLFLGATAAGVVLALRALPPVHRAIMRRQKPWACDTCMGFWTTGVLALSLAQGQHQTQLVLAAGPAYPLTLWLLRKLQEPMNPPQLPPLQE